MQLWNGKETDVATNEYCRPVGMWFYQADRSDLGHEAESLDVVSCAEAHHTAARCSGMYQSEV